MKAFLEGGAVVYLSTDSSPQGGRDYQIVVLDVVSKSDLAELHTSVQRLEWVAQLLSSPLTSVFPQQ